jgi:signal transduction histidine kinase
MRDAGSRSPDGPAQTKNTTAGKAAKKHLRRLSTAVLCAQDSERQRIARDLHDGPAQLLAGLTMNLCRLRDSQLDSELRGALLLEALELVDQCTLEIRTLSYLLHPPLLDESGLTTSLRNYIVGFARRSGIEIDVRIAPACGPLDPDIELTIFRTVQEALGNIHKHSGSRSAAVALECEAGKIRVEIRDSGCGFPNLKENDKGAECSGVGIRSMCERAELLGGRLDITSTGCGTTISLVLPLTLGNAENSNPDHR